MHSSTEWELLMLVMHFHQPDDHQPDDHLPNFQFFYACCIYMYVCIYISICIYQLNNHVLLVFWFLLILYSYNSSIYPIDFVFLQLMHIYVCVYMYISMCIYQLNNHVLLVFWFLLILYSYNWSWTERKPGQVEVLSPSWKPGPTRGTESLPV